MKAGNSENWVVGSRFDTKVDSFIDNHGDTGIRTVLVAYADSYNEQFGFDCVEDALAYLQLEDLSNQDVFLAVPSDITEAVNHGVHEYGFSIVAISNAVQRLLDGTKIDYVSARLILNYIWEAWACNDLDFRVREDIIVLLTTNT